MLEFEEIMEESSESQRLSSRAFALGGLVHLAGCSNPPRLDVILENNIPIRAGFNQYDS